MTKLITDRTLRAYVERLSDRDVAILESLAKCTFMLTGQIQRLHNTDASTQTAALRATAREMKKLKEYGLVKHLGRRIGGVRAGSSSLVWYLSEAGHRLLELDSGNKKSRKRHLEPSLNHLNHAIAVSACYVQMHEICRQNSELSLSQADTEPDCWRSYSRHGNTVQLKPDLFFATKCGEYEDRWFVEIDLATESPTTILRKCERYHDYYKTNLEQRKHGVFPVTMWLVPDKARKEVLRTAISKAYKKSTKMFLVIMPDELEELIVRGFDAKDLC